MSGGRVVGSGLSRTNALALARGLGWLSIALGTIELLAPRAVASRVDLAGRGGLVGSYGLREIAAGVGILAAADPTKLMWGRVSGDALDIATLLGGLFGSGRKAGAGFALLAVAGVTAADVVCARALSR